MKKYIKTFENFGDSSKKSWKTFYKGLQKEVFNNGELRRTVVKYTTGNKLTEDEKEFFKKQSLSLLKMLGLTTLIVLPASSIIIPSLVMGAKKFNINIIPDGFKKDDENDIDDIDDIISEVSHYEVEPHMTEPMKDPAGSVDLEWKSDEEFVQLLKDQGGRKGVIKNVKKKYKIDYSHCKTEEELHAQLKNDQMM